jgi:hypothetical protein
MAVDHFAPIDPQTDPALFAEACEALSKMLAAEAVRRLFGSQRSAKLSDCEQGGPARLQTPGPGQT